MKYLDFVTTLLAMIMGTIHVVLTPNFYDSFGEDAVFFIGMGLSIFLLGIINLMRLLSKAMTNRVLAMASNCLYFIYIFASAMVLGITEVQVIISISLVGIMTYCSIRDIRMVY